MDGVEILGTMAAEGAPWWGFLIIIAFIVFLIGVIAFVEIDNATHALIAISAVAFGIILGLMLQATQPEKQIALITDKASYTAIEAQYKVTKIDEHLYFLEVKEE